MALWAQIDCGQSESAQHFPSNVADRMRPTIGRRPEPGNLQWVGTGAAARGLSHARPRARYRQGREQSIHQSRGVGRDDMEARKGNSSCSMVWTRPRNRESRQQHTHRPGAHGEDTPYRWPETWVVFVPEDSCHPRGTTLWFHFATGRRPASGKRLPRPTTPMAQPRPAGSLESTNRDQIQHQDESDVDLVAALAGRVTLFILLPVVGGPCGVAGPGWKHGRSVRDGALALTRYSGRASLRPGLAVTSWTRAAVISEADHKCQSITTDLTTRFARRAQAELQCPGRAADQMRPGSTPRVPCADGLQRFGDDWPGLHQVFSRKAEGRFEETASMSSLTAGPSSD